MDDSGPSAGITFFILLLFTDIFFYGFGEAVRSLNTKEVDAKAQEGDKKNLRLKKMIEAPAEYGNTMELIVTLMNVVMGGFYLDWCFSAVAGALKKLSEGNSYLQHVPAGAIAVVSTILTMFVLLYILLTFGVLLPRKIAGRIPERWAYACITPAFFIIKLLMPFIRLVTASANGVMYLFGFRGRVDENDVTEEEIIHMVNEGHEQGVIQASEAEMISNIFEYGDKEAQDIMTHRKNIIAIDGDTVLKDAIDFMLAGTNSRYPVYEENLDHIIGILYLKDAMRFHKSEDKLCTPIKDLEGLLRAPQFVPQTKNIDALFQEMQQKKLQMAIVIDEYGQTDGLVAMEDILEEIVGNILDEYDEDKDYIEEKGKDEYLMEGTTPLEELEERLGISFNTGEFETLNGFLISRMDKIPEPDEKFDIDVEGYNFKIVNVENKMITSVLVTKLPEAEQEKERGEGQSALEEKDK